MTARAEVLARIAAAQLAAGFVDVGYHRIGREYRGAEPREGVDLVELLTDRLVDYRARVRTTTAAELPRTLAAALAEQGVRRLVAPPALPHPWLAEAGVEVVTDGSERRLTVAELDGFDGVLTGCAVAIAETGTLVLDGSEDQGRRGLTLVPDYHLCVVPEAVIVADVPHALVRLGPTRPLTFISGPSATSDIELNRVEGVHGPRTLEVVLVVERP
ncbi:MAG: lactate utilization protein C [Actinomycetes bacterium]